MTIDEAKAFLTNLRNQTTKKSELKVYDDFIETLVKLDHRKLSQENIASIEAKLCELKLKSVVNKQKKHIKKVLFYFKDFLKNEFSIITKGYYTAIGMSVGMCIGLSIGTAIERTVGISFGLSIGMLIGIAAGRLLDMKAEKEDRVL